MARTGRRFPSKPIILGGLQLAASVVAAPTGLPPQTVHVVQSHYPQRIHGGRDADVTLPQRQALAVTITPPRTVTIIDTSAPRRQRSGRVIAPRPAALAAFTPYQGPLRTTLLVEASTPRRRLRSVVIGPQRQALAAAVQAAFVAPPKTTSIVEAASPRRQRRSLVIGPQRQSLAAVTQAVFVAPPRPVVVQARTPLQRRRGGAVIAPHPFAVIVTPPRTVTVVDSAALQRRRPRTGRVIVPRPVIVTGNPPRTVTVVDQAAFRPRRHRRSRIILPSARPTTAAVTPTLITTPATGYVTVGDTSSTSVGDTGLVAVGSTGSALVGDTGIPRFSYAPTDVCVLGYSNQALGGTDVAAVEALIGRSFHGLRQNADISTNWVNTGAHISQFDLGRTASYRALQNDPATESYAAAISGTYDARFTTTVTNIVNSGRWSTTNPFIICYGHEVTVPQWDPLGTTQQFIDAFRHFRVLLDSLGASVHSVTGAFIGGPIIMAYVGWDRMFTNGSVNSPLPGKSYTDYDPDLGSSPAPAGTSYYELVGSDVYNNLSGGVVQYGTVAATLLDDVRAQAVARNKDWMIGEIACADGATSQNHTDKAAWWDSIRVYLDGCGTTSPGVCRYMFTTIKTDSNLYNVDSSAQSTAAWQRLGFDSYYA